MNHDFRRAFDHQSTAGWRLQTMNTPEPSGLLAANANWKAAVKQLLFSELVVVWKFSEREPVAVPADFPINQSSD